MAQLKLFMILLGCRVKGRYTEQHDIFFGIAYNIKELVPAINNFWPEAKGRLHVDAWRTITNVDGYEISVDIKEDAYKKKDENSLKLFFLNLGGYKSGDFEEYHYKILSVADTITQASKQAKESTFYKHANAPAAPAHIDDKYGIDVDDAYDVNDILPVDMKNKYKISIKSSFFGEEDVINIGYFKLSEL